MAASRSFYFLVGQGDDYLVTLSSGDTALRACRLSVLLSHTLYQILGNMVSYVHGFYNPRDLSLELLSLVSIPFCNFQFPKRLQF